MLKLSDVPSSEIECDTDARLSYSQFGEDLVAATILQIHKRLHRKGFYVDVGAHSPRFASNTYTLHKYYGRHGINVEPNIELVEQFRSARPDDITVQCAVGLLEGEADYYRFNHPGINTIDPAFAERSQAHPAYKLISVDKIPVKPLSNILADSIQGEVEIDLLNIDAEGLEFDVLSSNDWKRFRPFLIIAEDHNMNLNKLSDNKTHNFLLEKGYILVSYAVVSAFYMRVK